MNTVKEKHVMPDYSQEHLVAMQYYLDSQESEALKSDYSEAFVEIGDFNMVTDEFVHWCKKEEEVMGLMKDHNIESILKKINRKKKWNGLLSRFKVPFRFSTRKENKKFQGYLSEFFVRMNNCYDDSTNPIEYDTYRGQRPEMFRLNIDTYKKEYEKIMRAKMPFWKRVLGLFSASSA